MRKYLLIALLGLGIITSQAQPTGDFVRSIIAGSSEIAGDTLDIYFHVPSNFDFNLPATVIIGQHGLGTPDNSDQIRTFLTPVSDSLNALLICPDPYLQDQPKSRAALNEAIDSALTWYNIDEEEMYIVGYSAGSDVAAKYVFENPVHPMKGLIWHSPGFFANPNMSNQATFPPVCLCWGSQDLVSVVQNNSLDNTFSNSSVPYHHITIPSVAHTMDYPEFPAVMHECIDFIDANAPSGVNEIGLKNIRIYPNPIASGQSLVIEGLMETADLSIKDINGKIIQNFTLNSGYKNLAINNLSTGIYILNITTSHGVYNHKLLVNH